MIVRLSRRRNWRWPLSLWFSSSEEFWSTMEFSAWIAVAILLAIAGVCLDHSALN